MSIDPAELRKLLEERLTECFYQRTCGPSELVHQVSDWGSGVAIKMGRRQGGPIRTGGSKEQIWPVRRAVACSGIRRWP